MIIAVVLAFAAFGLAFIVLNNAQDEAKSSLKEVYIAKDAIPQGLTIDDNAFKQYFGVGKVETLPTDAVTSRSQVKGLVTKIAIPKDQSLSTAFFGSKQDVALASSNNEVAQLLPEGQVAVSFSVDQARGIAGFVATGDRVNFMVDLTTFPEARQEVGALGDGLVAPIPQLANVLVLKTTGAGAAAPGPATTTGAGSATAGNSAANAQTASSGLITVQATPEQAALIATLMNKGAIYLTLNPPAPTTTTAAGAPNGGK
ncbi:MAG: RcpC/CpaB family pilus assembly protein [Acidimicrobiia bacterium]